MISLLDEVKELRQNKDYRTGVFEEKKYKEAIFWYTMASKCEDVTYKGGFVERIYYNYYPFLQLCCCYFYLNEIDKAISYNEKAGKHLLTDTVKKNREFFSSLAFK